MRARQVRLLALGVLLVAGAGVAFLASRPVQQGATPVDSPLIGTVAPTVAGPTLGGHGRVALASLRGRVVVLSFFASWCGACGEEAPSFAAFAWHEHRTHAPVRVLGVVYNDQDAAAAAFAARYGLTFPVIEDPGGAIANAFGVAGPPVTVVVAADGRVASVLAGPVTASQLATATDRAARA